MNDPLKHTKPQEDHLDEFFRSALAHHTAEPPPRIWNGIRRKLLFRELLHFNFANFSYHHWFYLSLPVALLVIGLFLIPAEDTPSLPAEKHQPGPAAETPSVPSASPVSGTTPDRNTHTGAKGSGEIPAVRSDVPSKPAPTHTSIIAHNDPAKVTEISSAPASDMGSVQPSALAAEVLTDESPAEPWLTTRRIHSGMTFLKPLKASLLSELLPPDTFVIIKTVRGEEKFRIDKPGLTRSMITGQLGVLPELAFYDEGEKYNKMNYWLHGGIDWHLSSFSVGTALELGYMYDQGKYRVDYKSRDSVGFYTVVVSFAAGPDNEVVYHTQMITLYDSILHRDDPRTNNRYTYLRIPVLLGYKIFEHNRFSLTFRAGPALTLLLGNKKGEPVIEYANARIIRIDEETPARMKTNWQIWADLMLEMRINEKFSLYIEPSWKYFFRPTADQENIHSKPPWSIGVGLGVQFNFEPNQRNQIR